MKKNLSLFLACFMLLLCSSWRLNAQNLLVGNDMESASSWSLAPFNTTDVVSEWGYTTDKPLSGNGGALHVQVTNVTGSSQFGFYQAVQLTGGVKYTLDGAIKIIDKVKTSWLEVYVGNVDPSTLTDYSVPNATALGTPVNGIAKIASYFSWWTSLTTPPKPNSTFLVGASQKTTFTPVESGTYYFLVKVGSNAAGKANILIDNLMFGENITPLQTVPTSSFVSNKRVGFAPLTVNFESTALRANSYKWNLSEGDIQTTATASHTYTTPGKYTVSLKAINELGTDSVGTKDFIEVMAPVEVTAGGSVLGGNMEDSNAWSVNFLNSPIDLGQEGSNNLLNTTWNYIDANTPTAGNGGALRVQITAHGGDVVQYCIYQKVNLSNQLIYRFNGAFRDNSTNLWRAWTEVFISANAPVTGSDFGTAQGTRLAALSNWETKTGVVRGLDGTYKLNTTVAGYTPPATGEYYLVYKIGVQGNGITAAVPANSCDIVIDEFSLTETHPKPFIDFTAENESGFSPITVNFKNKSQYADSYEWDFGDGSPKSTDFEPVHTYTVVGDYTVKLKGRNINGDSTLVKTAFVSVVEPYELPDGEKLYGGNMEKGGFWKTSPYGPNLKSTVTWNYKDEPLLGSEGGFVRVVNGRIAFFQPVQVKAGYVYKFDCDVKVKNTSTNMWIQTFMWPTEPPQDADVMLAANTMAELRTYADATVAGYEGKFSEKCTKGASYAQEKGTFRATETTTMWFAIKFGTNGTMDVLIDNLSLKELLPPPTVDFTSLVTSGEAPLSVDFYDLSDASAVSWLWNFGDGATSTDQDPVHIYTNSGSYTVSLTATNSIGLSSTKTVENYITVTGGTGIKNILPAGYSIFAKNGSVVVSTDKNTNGISIFDIHGILVDKSFDCQFVSKKLNTGLYIVKANGYSFKVMVK